MAPNRAQTPTLAPVPEIKIISVSFAINSALTESFAIISELTSSLAIISALVRQLGEPASFDSERRSRLPACQLMETACCNYEPVSRRVEPGLGFAAREPPGDSKMRRRDRPPKRRQKAPQREFGTELRVTPASVALFRAIGDAPKKPVCLAEGPGFEP
jgi:hypothetical protein